MLSTEDKIFFLQHGKHEIRLDLYTLIDQENIYMSLSIPRLLGKGKGKGKYLDVIIN